MEGKTPILAPIKDWGFKDNSLTDRNQIPYGACSPIQFLTKKPSRIKNKPYLRIPMLGSFLFW
ncbi:MAG: hypothetical protein UU40_C0022G0001, partial [Candidatus Uhrbacteria bacterium GW2011_GWD2_41_121]